MVTMDESRLEFTSYHMKCYRSYIRKGDRSSKQLNTDDGGVAPVIRQTRHQPVRIKY